MRRGLWWFLGALIGTWFSLLAYAGVPENVPPIDDPLLGKFLNSLANHLNTLECLTADPNGSVLGTRGELKCATFGGATHMCMNTSTGPSKGTTWFCISQGDDCMNGSTDNQVLVNESEQCTGDAGFIYDGALDHASLGPDAAIDKVFAPNNFNIYNSASSQMLTLSDVRSEWPGTILLEGIGVEIKAEPSGTEGFNNLFPAGITSRIIVDGSAGTTAATQDIVDSLFVGGHFNALTQVRGTGSVDRIDVMQGRSLNSEVILNLSGTGTNDIDAFNWEAINDEITITADTADNISIAAHQQELNFTVPTLGNSQVANAGFLSKNTITASTSGGSAAIIQKGFESNTDVTITDADSITTTHFYGLSDYLLSSNTGDNTIVDYGLRYDMTVGGATTVDAVVSRVITSNQTVDLEALDDGPGIILGSPDWAMWGWQATQTIGANNDSGTFEQMRGFELTQTWSGDAPGTTVDGIYISGLAKAGSGTVTTATNIDLVAPVRTAGTLTNAFTIQLTVPTTGGTENAGIRFANGIADLIEFEGNTANAFETRLSVVEPTADRTITIPDETGTVATCGSSTTCAGVWTPTPVDIANLDASSSAAEGQYMRVGATVSGSVQITVNPTLTATSTQTELDLPVASNFGATSDAAGTCFAPGIAGQGAAITADATSNELEVRWISTDVTAQEMDCVFSYQVI